MKNILAFILTLAISFAFPQEVKPKFEKKGNQTEATFYHDNGIVAQHGFFNKENKLEGTWTSFDAEGNKTAVANYKAGVKDGKWFFWNDNTLKEVDYANNTITNVNEWENKSTLTIRD